MLSFKNKTETRFSKKVDRLFWIFIMMFPLLSYLIGVRANFAFPEKEIDKTLYVSVGDLEYYSDVDFAGGQIVLQDLNGVIIEFYDKTLFTTSGGYKMVVGIIPDIWIETPSGEYIYLYLAGDRELIMPVYNIPDDFGFIELNLNTSTATTLDGISSIIKSVNGPADIISTQSFSYYWENALGFKPITDNVVGNALTDLFDKGGFLGFFDNSYMIVTLLVWFVVVELAHLFIDIVLFIPRLAHKWMNCFTQTD